MDCEHSKAHFEDWPDGGSIEVCEDCGVSRYHWEWGETDWIMIEDIAGTRKKLQEGIDRAIKTVKKIRRINKHTYQQIGCPRGD